MKPQFLESGVQVIGWIMSYNPAGIFFREIGVEPISPIPLVLNISKAKVMKKKRFEF